MTKALAFLAAVAFTAVLSAPVMADHHEGHKHAKGEKHECKDCKDKDKKKNEGKGKKGATKNAPAATHAEEGSHEGHGH